MSMQRVNRKRSRKEFLVDSEVTYDEPTIKKLKFTAPKPVHRYSYIGIKRKSTETELDTTIFPPSKKTKITHNWNMDFTEAFATPLPEIEDNDVEMELADPFETPLPCDEFDGIDVDKEAQFIREKVAQMQEDYFIDLVQSVMAEFDDIEIKEKPPVPIIVEEIPPVDHRPLKRRKKPTKSKPKQSRKEQAKIAKIQFKKTKDYFKVETTKKTFKTTKSRRKRVVKK